MAVAPNAKAERRSQSRRDKDAARGSFMRSFLGYGFVEVEQHVGNEPPRIVFAGTFAFRFVKEIDERGLL